MHGPPATSDRCAKRVASALGDRKGDPNWQRKSQTVKSADGNASWRPSVVILTWQWKNCMRYAATSSKLAFGRVSRAGEREAVAEVVAGLEALV